jgi:hypothetical protein
MQIARELEAKKSKMWKNDAFIKWKPQNERGYFNI